MTIPAPSSQTGGRRVLLATLGHGSLDRLAAALARQGAEVSVLTQGTSPGSDPHPVMHGSSALRATSWDATSRATTQRSVNTLLQQSGEPTQLVVLALPAAAVVGSTVAEHDTPDWRAACGAATLQTIHLLQTLAPALKAQRASIVFVGASLGLVGSERLAGLVSLLESQRGLMKSLARQWGKHGVTSNWVALEARELWPGFADFKLPMRLEAIPVALGRRPDAGADLAGALDFLASPAGRVVTGTTWCLDGGEWMTP